MYETTEDDTAIVKNSGLPTAANPNVEFYPDLVVPNNQPIGFNPAKPGTVAPPPTNVEVLEAAWRQYNMPYAVGKSLLNADRMFSNIGAPDERQEIIDSGMLDTVPREYLSNVLNERTKSGAQRVIDNINQELEDRDTMNRSSNLQSVVTTLGATIADPTILYSPAVKAMTYASYGKGIVKGAINASKYIPISMAQNAALIGPKETQGLADWGVNVLTESFLGAAIGGAAGAFATKGVLAEARVAKGVFKSIADDVEIKIGIGENGEYTKLIAKPMEGSSVGAAEVENIQQLLDSGQVQFKNNKFVKTIMGYGSPMIEGVTNTFETIRRVTPELFPVNFELAGGVAQAIQGQSAWAFVKMWQATNEHANIFIREQWLASLGITSKPGEGLQAAVDVYKNKYISLGEFEDLVGMAERRGNKSDNPFVQAAAELRHKEVTMPLWEEVKKRYPNMRDNDFTNIVSNLSRIYNQDKIKLDPQGFQDAVVEYITGVNEAVIAKDGPITFAKQNIAKIEAEIARVESQSVTPTTERYVKTSDQITDVNQRIQKEVEKADRLFPGDEVSPEKISYAEKTLLPLIKERTKLEQSISGVELNAFDKDTLKVAADDLKLGLAEQQKTLADLESALQKEIDEGALPLDMLTGVPELGPEQVAKIEALNLPIAEGEAELKAAREELQKLGTLKNVKSDLAENLSGISSGAISSVAESVEKFGKNKTLNAMKSYAKRFKDAQKTMAEQSRKIRALKKEQNDLIKDLNRQKTEKKQLIKEMETKLAAVPKANKKEAKALKTQIANEQSNLKNIPTFVEDAKKKITSLNEELDGLKVGDYVVSTAKEAANDAIPFVKNAIENLSEAELEKQIAMVRAGIKRINKESLTNAKIKRNTVRRKIKAAKEKVAAGKKFILDEVRAKRITEDLYENTQYGPKLLDINARPKLRNILDVDQIKNVAEGVYNNVTNLNPDQLLGEIFHNANQRGNDIFKSRVLLWNDKVAEPWLVSNSKTISESFVNQAAKRIYYDDFLKKYGSDSKQGMDGIIKNLTTERAEKEAAILLQPASAARDKALKKLDNDFNKGKKLLKDFQSIFMGDYVNKDAVASKLSSSVKMFTSAVMLGGLPLISLTDFLTPMFRLTFKEFVIDGLVPTIKRYSLIASEKSKAWGSANRKYIRGSYADIGIGVNKYNGNKMKAMASYGTAGPQGNIFERGVENISKFSSSLTLMNELTDFQETVVATAFESNVIRTLKRYQEGIKLEKFEINMLDRAKINPAQLAESMLENYRIYGKDMDGGFVPNFHQWADQDAARSFRMGIKSLSDDVLLRPGPLDVPFSVKNDPFMSLLFQFTSYAFTATNKFTVPLLTQPDSRMLTGTVFMMAGGALVGPLRQLAYGDEVDMSTGALVNGALANSGVLGMHWDIAMRANSKLDLAPLRFMQPERFQRDVKGFELGPASSILSYGSDFLSAAASGEMNQRDLKKGAKVLLPFSGTWYLRRLLDKGIQNTGLAETRAEAASND